MFSCGVMACLPPRAQDEDKKSEKKRKVLPLTKKIKVEVLCSTHQCYTEFGVRCWQDTPPPQLSSLSVEVFLTRESPHLMSWLRLLTSFLTPAKPLSSTTLSTSPVQVIESRSKCN